MLVEKIEYFFAEVAYYVSELIRFIHPLATKAEAGAKDENIHPDQGNPTISLRSARTPPSTPVLRTKNSR